MFISEFLPRDISAKQLSDILVQIIELYIYSGEGRGAMCPENIVVATSAKSDNWSKGRVSFGESAGYSESVYPVPNSTSAEKNDVFCLGVIATRLLGGECDISEAGLLLLDVDEGKPYPACGPVRKDDPLCALISSMTDLNVETRPTMNECLKRLTALQAGKAIVDITDRDTGTVLDNISIKLTAVETPFYPQNMYEYNRRRYIPEEMPRSGYITMYYSVFPERFPFYVTLDRPNPDSMKVRRKADIPCIGIDFGTFSSSVSYINPCGLTKSILFDSTDYVPSAVFFKTETEMLFGNSAIAAGKIYPEALCTEFKRSFCRGDNIVVTTAESRQRIEKSAFSVVCDFLSYIKSNIERKFGNTENARLVATVPACYDAGQKTSFLKACRCAALEADILTEPEAAAIYFGEACEPGKKMVIFDLGGGTLDVSLLISEDSNGAASYSIKRRNGEEMLGGVDFTNGLCKYLCRKVHRKYGINTEAETAEDCGLSEYQFEHNRRALFEAAEAIKCELSRHEHSEKTVSLYRPDSAAVTFNVIACDSEEYETNVIEPTDLLRTMKNSLGSVISDCGYAPEDIDELVITGGASLTPKVRQMLFEFFEGCGCRINFTDHRSAISKGAAKYANDLETNDVTAKVLSETEYDIGVMLSGRTSSEVVFSPIIKAGTKFDHGVINSHIPCILTEEEKKLGFCKLILYRRPRGYEMVQSTFEHDGDIIKSIGALYVEQFPEGFDPYTGRVHFTLTLDSQECISANIAFFVPSESKGPFGRKQSSEVRLALCSAMFIPKGQNV